MSDQYCGYSFYNTCMLKVCPTGQFCTTRQHEGCARASCAACPSQLPEAFVVLPKQYPQEGSRIR